MEKKEKTLAEKEAEIHALKQFEAEELLIKIRALLAEKGANIIPIVKIQGNIIIADWAINIP